MSSLVNNNQNQIGAFMLGRGVSRRKNENPTAHIEQSLGSNSLPLNRHTRPQKRLRKTQTRAENVFHCDNLVQKRSLRVICTRIEGCGAC